MGYSVETGVEMGYRDARITRIYEGTNEINRMLSFAELMKRAFKTKEVNLLGAGKKLPLFILKRALPFQKKTIQNTVENFKALFLILSGTAGKKLGMKLADEQELVMDLSDLLSEAYVAESLYLRTEKIKTLSNNTEEIDIKKAILELHIYMSIQKIQNKAYTIIDSLPEKSRKKFLKWTVKILTKQLDINPTELRRKIALYFIAKGNYSW